MIKQYKLSIVFVLIVGLLALVPNVTATQASMDGNNWTNVDSILNQLGFRFLKNDTQVCSGASYCIYNQSGTIIAVNGTTQNVDYSGNAIETLLESVVNNLPDVTYYRTIVVYGDYTILSDAINLDKDYVILDSHNAIYRSNIQKTILSYQNSNYVKIMGGKFVGSRYTQTGSPLRCIIGSNVSNLEIAETEVTECKDRGIETDLGTNVNIHHNKVHDNGLGTADNGIMAYNTATPYSRDDLASEELFVRIEDNEIYNHVGGQAIDTGTISGVFINRNVIYNIDGNPINIDTGNNITVCNNQIFNTTQKPIGINPYYGNMSHIKVCNNHLKGDKTTNGIEIKPAAYSVDDITISDNQLFGFTGGIVIQPLYYNFILDFSNESKVTNATISDNHINYVTNGFIINESSNTVIEDISINGGSVRQYTSRNVKVVGSPSYSVSNVDGVDTTQTFANLVKNGDFESWNNGVPDTWTKTGTGSNISVSVGYINQRSANLTCSDNNSCLVRQELEDYLNVSYYRGKKLTFSVWVYSDASNRVVLKIGDGIGTRSGNYHEGTGWELMSVSRTMSTSSTQLRPQVYVDAGTELSIKIDGAILTEGTNILIYSPKSLEDDGYSIQINSTSNNVTIPNLLTTNLTVNGVAYNGSGGCGSDCPNATVAANAANWNNTYNTSYEYGGFDVPFSNGSSNLTIGTSIQGKAKYNGRIIEMSAHSQQTGSINITLYNQTLGTYICSVVISSGTDATNSCTSYSFVRGAWLNATIISVDNIKQVTAAVQTIRS